MGGRTGAKQAGGNVSIPQEAFIAALRMGEE
jgi:translation elongation factor EF-4